MLFVDVFGWSLFVFAAVIVDCCGSFLVIFVGCGFCFFLWFLLAVVVIIFVLITFSLFSQIFTVLDSSSKERAQERKREDEKAEVERSERAEERRCLSRMIEEEAKKKDSAAE